MGNSTNRTRFIGFFIVFLLLSSVVVQAQTSYYFYVQFKDKNNTPYSLSNPADFLSARSIARRTAFGISCDSTDLPVNLSYLQQIKNLGIQVHNVSKWMNGATVLLSDSSLMSQIRSLSCVKFVEYTGLLNGPVLAPSSKVTSQKATLNYGVATTQINQLNGTGLHNEGYRGKGIQIAVIDAGFTNVNINPCFDSLRLQGRLLGTKDIINPNSNIFAEDTHGAMVLSTMTGNLPGQFLGTAPDASFWLIRTEYSPTEYKVETDFWASGIEYADSVGVDVVNSSLGYTQFDDPLMNFTYSDMNGKVSRASRAANLASKKGIIVCSSAGNEGNASWHYISSPADADGIVTVGAITSTGISSVFSSFGPSYDGRIKPEICAMGTSASVVSTGGLTTTDSGTSFSSPITAGLMACLLQRYKTLNSTLNLTTLLNSVFESGSLYNNPTAQMGYGIPDFTQAEQNLITLNSLQQINNSNLVVAYNSANKNLNIRFIGVLSPVQASVRIYSITGNMLLNQSLVNSSTYFNVDNFPTGIYAVCVTENGKMETRKIIIQ
ncbi:MAG: S8 family serine peptidase [Paludibacter sp.]|nr:S8 family serine peptidase [Paludibacter sp.]